MANVCINCLHRDVRVFVFASEVKGKESLFLLLSVLLDVPSFSLLPRCLSIPCHALEIPLLSFLVFVLLQQ